MIRLSSIVEGQGEIEAVPLVVRRIARLIDPRLTLQVHPPFRIPRSRLIQPGVLEHYVDVAVRRAGSGGSLLIVLDSDDDDPAELGPQLLARARTAGAHVPISVVLAHREFESWFLAAAESLRRCRGLAADLTAPPDPEAIRGAKEWLSTHMEKGRTYAPVLDQPALSATFDIATARRRSPSFDLFCREVARLLTVSSAPEET